MAQSNNDVVSLTSDKYFLHYCYHNDKLIPSTRKEVRELSEIREWLVAIATVVVAVMAVINRKRH